MAGRILSDNWQVARPCPLEAAFYGGKIERVLPESYAELADVVRYAEARRRPLVPAGRGAHAYVGNPPPPGALVVSLERLAAVLRYEPDDFTIGVGAGLPLTELRELLESNGQEIAADLPPLGTIGGCVATGLPGPRRARNGPLRSSLIGVHGMRSGGRIYKAGGMVVKNVAGYEVGKFLVGSLGTAGVILEVNFKLRPLPAGRRGGRAAFGDSRDAWEFVRKFRQRRLEPACLTMLDAGAARRLRRRVPLGEAPHCEVLWLFEGNEAALEWLQGQARELCREAKTLEVGSLEGEETAAALSLVSRLHEPEAPPEKSEAIVRISVLPGGARNAAELLGRVFEETPAVEYEIFSDLPSGQLVARWHGGPAYLEKPLESIPDVVREARGAGWLIYLPPASRRRWNYLLLEEPALALSRRILKVFNPLGIFCPGRVDGVVSITY